MSIITKKLIIVLFFCIQFSAALFLLVLTSSCSSRTQGVHVSCIANEGIVIYDSLNKRHILIDALFDNFYPQYESPTDSIILLINQNSPPFAGNRIALFTHLHADHFNANMVATELSNTNLQRLVLPRQAASLLLSKGTSDKIEVIDQPYKVIKINSSLKIECFLLLHTNPSFKDITNIAYLITISEKKILHFGDALINDENLSRIKNQDIDLVILPYFVLDENALDLINQKFSNPKIAPVHFDIKSKERWILKISSLPNMLLLTVPLKMKRL